MYILLGFRAINLHPFWGLGLLMYMRLGLRQFGLFGALACSATGFSVVSLLTV